MNKIDAKKIERFIGQSVTVADLREMLEEFDDDTPVLFACDYGDMGQTQQVLTIDVAKATFADELCTSGYSRSGFALEDPEDWDECDDGYGSDADAPPVVILS